MSHRTFYIHGIPQPTPHPNEPAPAYYARLIEAPTHNEPDVPISFHPIVPPLPDPPVNAIIARTELRKTILRQRLPCPYCPLGHYTADLTYVPFIPAFVITWTCGVCDRHETH